jgi:hypothetical protein
MDLIMDANFHRVSPQPTPVIPFLNSMYCYCYHTKVSMFTLRSYCMHHIGLLPPPSCTGP